MSTEEETRWGRADRIMAERMEAFMRKWGPGGALETVDFRIDFQEIMLSAQRQAISAFSDGARAGRSIAAPPAAPSDAPSTSYGRLSAEYAKRIFGKMEEHSLWEEAAELRRRLFPDHPGDIG